MKDQPNAVLEKNCPICSSSVELWRIKHTDSGDHRIDKCSACGYAFVNPRPTMKFLEELYSSGVAKESAETDNITVHDLMERERKFPNSTKDAKRIFTTIDALGVSKERRLLDIGCGYGFFSKEAQTKGFTLDAIEIDSTKTKQMYEMTGVEPKDTLFEDFEHEENYYSVILMSQILEHVRDVKGWISKARTLLADDGLLVIAVPNFDGIFRRIMQENEPYIIPPEHLNFFGSKNLTLLLENEGLYVEKVQWVSRIRPIAFEKRFAWTGVGGRRMFQLASTGVMSTIDILRLGLFINVYARKRP